MSISDEKILVFDADVIIHFMRADKFSDLRFFYPNNKKVILNKVKEELSVFRESASMIDSAINTFSFLEVAEFPISMEMKKEFAHLTSSLIDFGKGESACMSYCKFTKNVVVSSNLRDVGQYCKRHDIDLITTLDLLEWALSNKVWTSEECNNFITIVLKRGGRLPCKTIEEYINI